MKNTIVGFFILSVVLVFGAAEAQIGGKTYQRVKSSQPAEQKKSAEDAPDEVKSSKIEEKSVISDEIGGGHLTIGENLELTFPAGLKECRVFDVLEDKHPASIDHPLVITNDTGRAIIFKTPKNGGCTVIMRKKDVAILGLTFEGAICR
ncbi:MAG: hypothetical protein HYU98_04725 [Deltaproteobacteria bacterium]|nr:hypothetical protein [Deltaproteobacteria bacterium]